MTDDDLAVVRTRREPVPLDPAAPLPPLASLPLNTKRFNYFNIEVINPYCPDPLWPNPEPSSDDTDRAVHLWQEQRYRERFEKGSRQALLEYANADPDAFESLWFRAEVKRLRLARNSPGLERIFTAYRTTQGKRNAALLSKIERDQRVFRLVVDWPKRFGRDRTTLITQQEIYIDVGATENMVPGTVEQIAKHYQRYYKRVVPRPFSPPEFFAHLTTLLVRMKNSVSTKRT